MLLQSLTYLALKIILCSSSRADVLLPALEKTDLQKENNFSSLFAKKWQDQESKSLLHISQIQILYVSVHVLFLKIVVHKS